MFLMAAMFGSQSANVNDDRFSDGYSTTMHGASPGPGSCSGAGAVAAADANSGQDITFRHRDQFSVKLKSRFWSDLSGECQQLKRSFPLLGAVPFRILGIREN